MHMVNMKPKEAGEILKHYARSYSCILFPLRQGFPKSDYDRLILFALSRDVWKKLQPDGDIAKQKEVFMKLLDIWGEASLTTISGFENFFDVIDSLEAEATDINKEHDNIIKLQKSLKYIIPLCKGTQVETVE